MNKFVDRMEKLYGPNDKNGNNNYVYVDKKGFIGIVLKPVLTKVFNKGIISVEIVHKSETAYKTLILTDEEKKVKTLMDADTFTILTANFPEMKKSCFIPNDSTVSNALPFIGQLDEEYYLIASPLNPPFDVATDLMSEKI